MRSTHGSDSPGSFRAVLADAGSAEADTLAGLLLFPAEAVRVALEPDLEACACTPGEARLLADRVAATVDAVPALLPGGHAVLLEPDAAALRGFVARLRPEANPPRELAGVAQRRHAPPLAWRLKAALRAGPLVPTAARLFFLEALLDRMDAPNQEQQVLEWALRFLEHLPEDVPPHQALAPRREELSMRLDQALDFRKALAGSSFEVISSQGVRMPHLHPQSLREEIALLDAVCLAVTGRPGWTLEGVARRDMGAVRDADSLLEALGRLEG